MATPQSGQKTMSSRLLTMKFMQRATSAQGSPSTPPSSNGRPSKRVRLSNGIALPVTPSAQQEAIKAALDAEEQKRLEALEKHAADHGETRWVLSVQETPEPAERLNVVTAGFGDIDALDNSEDEEDRQVDGAAPDQSQPNSTGRRVFGQLKRALPEQNADVSDSSVSSSDEEEDNDPTAQFIRESRKQAEADRYAKQRAQQAEQKRRADEQRPKMVNLKGLTSISGGGSGRSTPKTRPPGEMKCFKCGRPGHKKSDCPN